MWWAFVAAAVLVLLGLMVDRFKLYFLISGYNTMSKAKREKVDIAQVARLMALWAYANAAVAAVVGVLLAFDLAVPWAVVAAFFTISTVYMLVRVQRYDGNLFDESGSLRPGAWKQLSIVGVVLVALVGGLIVLVVSLERSGEVDTMQVVAGHGHTSQPEGEAARGEHGMVGL